MSVFKGKCLCTVSSGLSIGATFRDLVFWNACLACVEAVRVRLGPVAVTPVGSLVVGRG